MDLVPGYYYHIYNRGNNSQQIFLKRENYLFFLKKMKEHLSPFVSIMAWCLMPNHFHWVVFVHKQIIEIENSDTLTQESRHPNFSRETTESESGLPTLSSGDHLKKKYQTLNQSIGILLSSYTRALQKQEKFTGSLFQKHTKAKPLIDEIRIEPAYWNTSFGTLINIPEGRSYLETCVEYVHLNPVYDSLVEKAEEWEFSSCSDYLGLRDGKLLDYELIEKEDLFLVDSRHPNLSRETTIHECGLSTPSSGDHLIEEQTNSAIIGIGSNINAEKNIAKMLDILKTKVDVLRVSSMVSTKPIGIENQADFTNGAVLIQTVLSQTELNKLLKEIEDQMGRDRTAPKFGPRCIDLDIVVWNREIVDEDYYTRDFLQKSVKELGGLSSPDSQLG